MIFDLQQLDLIDLLSEHHVRIRQLCNELWNKKHDIYISDSEWLIMAISYNKQPTISSITKKINISRQATHKIIKNMENNGLVEVNKLEDSNKHKCLRLTLLGERYYRENELIKEAIEKHIVETIGLDKVNQLKELLKLDWGLSAL